MTPKRHIPHRIAEGQSSCADRSEICTPCGSRNSFQQVVFLLQKCESHEDRIEVCQLFRLIINFERGNRKRKGKEKRKGRGIIFLFLHPQYML